jgi:hypothetical protein
MEQSQTHRTTLEASENISEKARVLTQMLQTAILKIKLKTKLTMAH